jgi:glyoxylase-like metal-dependent hydrolase (beta-lactamase superfamily II)
MRLIPLPLGPMGNVAYLLSGDAGGPCAVVDPGWEAEAVLDAVSREGFTLEALILTHHHFDHSGAAGALLRRRSVPVFVHSEDAPFLKGLEGSLRPSSDGEVLRVGGLEINLLHTPGHTRGSQCLLCEGRLLTGDTLFIGSCGRTDLPGGDPRDLYGSLRRIASLPGQTEIFPGHRYAPRPSARLADERRENPVLAASVASTLEGFLRAF